MRASAAIVCLLCVTAPANAQQSLTSQDTLRFELGAGDTLAFSLHLDAGDLARVRGTRRVGAVWFEVVAPDGTRTRHFNPVGSAEGGPILFGVDAVTTGAHRIEIGSFTPSSDVWITLDSRITRPERERVDAALRSDPRVASVRASMIPFSQLEGDAVRALVGDARIVLIGEDSHANGNNRARVVELVRELHASAGFSIVVLEASFYDVAKSVSIARSGAAPLEETLLRGVHGNRGSDADTRALFQHIAESSSSSTPLEPWGMDNQFAGAARAGGPWAADSLVADLEGILRHAGFGAELRAEVRPFMEAIGVRLGTADGSAMPARAPIVRAGRILADSLDAEGFPFWAQVARSTVSHIAGGGVARRDRAMADNLDWILEHHPDRKLIVLGANGHLVPLPQEMDTNGLDGWFRFSVGQHVWETRPDEAFFIQSTTFGGTFNWTATALAGDRPVTIFEDQLPGVELEEIIRASEVGDGVLPLSELDWLDEPIPSRMPWNYWTMVSRWKLHADAVLYVEEAVPIRVVRPGGSR